MQRRLLGLLLATLLVAGAGVALAADLPPAVPVEEAETDAGEVAEGLPPFLVGDMPMPPGLAERDELPYGLAKQLDPDLLPPGSGDGDPADEASDPTESDEAEFEEGDSEEAESEDGDGLPPFLTGDMPMPPGLAERDELPYGLAKKLDPDLLPPGLQPKVGGGNGGPPSR